MATRMRDGRFLTTRVGSAPGTVRMQLRDEPLLPDAGEVNETVRLSVLALLQGSGLKKDTLAQVLAVSRGTIFNKLAPTNARPFYAHELAQLAAFFEVPITDLYDGLGGRVGRARLAPVAPATLSESSGEEVGARSSTDRASDYGSVVRLQPSRRPLPALSGREQMSLRPTG